MKTYEILPPEQEDIEMLETVPIQEDDFVQQLRKTPWWILSCGVHGLALFAIGTVMIFTHATTINTTTTVIDVPRQDPDKDRFKPIDDGDPTKPPTDIETDPLGPIVKDPVFIPDVPLSDATRSNDHDPLHNGFKGDSPDFLSTNIGKGTGRGMMDIDGVGNGVGPLGGIIGVGPGDGGGKRGGRHGDETGSNMDTVTRFRKNHPHLTTDTFKNKSLRWLANHQDEDGKWDAAGYSRHCKGDICTGAGDPRANSGITGLALLAFLGSGHTTRDGQYRTVVKSGVDWLVTIQKPDGDLRNGYSMYSHAIAAMALVEAYGMNQQDYKLKGPAQKAVDFIVEAQNPALGGWRYDPKQDSCDTSVVGWQIMALKSAKMSGLRVPEKTLEGARKWLDSVASGDYKGKFGYQTPGDGPRTTPIGLVSLLFMGLPAGDQRIEEGLLSVESRGLMDWAAKDFYRWYYATLAMNLAGGDRWKKWDASMQKALVPNQCKAGHAEGSWDPESDIYANGFGRVGTTAIGALCLEASYRYNLMMK